MTTFCLGISEFGMMGILENVADSLQISIVTAGHLISAYSLGVAIGAPGLILLRRWPMKRLLLMLVTIMCAGNICAALAPSYFMLLCSRFLSGLPHGAFFGAAAIVAERLAPEGKKAQAVAVMVGGMTIANVAGVPVATFLSNTLNWRLAFATVGLLRPCGLPVYKTLGSLHIAAARHRNQRTVQVPPQSRAMARIFRSILRAGRRLLLAKLHLAHHDPGDSLRTGRHDMDYDCCRIRYGDWQRFCRKTRRPLPRRPCHRHNLRNSSCCDARHIFLLPIQNSVGNTRIHRAGMSVWHRGPLQYLIVKYAKGGEMLGGAGIQIAFNVSNAVSASIGGMAIRHGLGIASPALIGLPFAAIGAISLLILYRKYPVPANTEQQPPHSPNI